MANYATVKRKIPFLSSSHVEGKAPIIAPIDPNEDNKRTVHFSQPNTSLQGLWMGLHVFHIMLDTIEVSVNTKRMHHRLLYTLYFLAFEHDNSGFPLSVCELGVICPPKRLLFSLSAMVVAHYSRPQSPSCPLPGGSLPRRPS